MLVFKRKLIYVFLLSTLQGFVFVQPAYAFGEMAQLLWDILKDTEWSKEFAENSSPSSTNPFLDALHFYCQAPAKRDNFGIQMGWTEESCKILVDFPHDPSKREEIFSELLKEIKNSKNQGS